MTYVIGDECIDTKDQKCVGQCPVDCIYIADRMAYIQPDECIDCGACVTVCPVQAISYEHELPAEKAFLIARQAQVFEVIGSPGGAREFGPVADHPDVAAMSRKN